MNWVVPSFDCRSAKGSRPAGVWSDPRKGQHGRWCWLVDVCCLFPPKTILHGSRVSLSLLHPQGAEQGLAHSRCFMNAC